MGPAWWCSAHAKAGRFVWLNVCWNTAWCHPTSPAVFLNNIATVIALGVVKSCLVVKRRGWLTLSFSWTWWKNLHELHWPPKLSTTAQYVQAVIKQEPGGEAAILSPRGVGLPAVRGSARTSAKWFLGNFSVNRLQSVKKKNKMQDFWLWNIFI